MSSLTPSDSPESAELLSSDVSDFVTSTPIDFSQTPLAPHYDGAFALILDNLLTPAECTALLASAGTSWESLSKGDSFRECQRIIAISPAWSAALYSRLLPHLPSSITALTPGGDFADSIAGASALKGRQGKRRTVWRLQKVNERLSFLRYGRGGHFKPHCDSMSTRGEGKSFVTVQVYLNDAEVDGGGATRFWAPRQGLGRKSKKEDGEGVGEGEEDYDQAFIDVEPKMGRAVVFQQRLLWHSGEEVKKGEKFTVRLDLMYERGFE